LHDLNIIKLTHFARKEIILDINMDIPQDFNHPSMQISLEQFKEYSEHPSNFFYICEYKGVTLGLMFVLKLKTEILNKILNFEI